MDLIRTTTFALALAATAALAGCNQPATKTTAAVKAPPPMTPKDSARLETGKTIATLMSPTFNDDQQGRIINIGYYMAASALCPDLEVDAGKLGHAVSDILAVDADKQTPAEKARQHDALLMFMGMSSGAMIGSHMEDRTVFCADAAKLKAGAADTHLFTEGPPSAPSTAPVPASTEPPAPTPEPKK